MLLQSERLKIAKALPEALVLQEGLLNFQVKITDAANDSYGAWREGSHDDLVLAVAVAAWFGEWYRPPQLPEDGRRLDRPRSVFKLVFVTGIVTVEGQSLKRPTPVHTEVQAGDDDPEWARRDSNARPLAPEASALSS